jgi:CHAT domain-containing protein
MLGFHRRLRAGGGQPVSKAEALRQSVLRLMQRPQYRHPFYWAGFVLVGDAQ